ncbi:MAG TPA: hypothetical protein VMK32_07730 [Burkholderiaceae bacterium]|nr:hypothetical protein [Burkholderiaceae bacterium]
MIDRRDFLKIAGCVVPYWGLIPVSNAQSIYSGKILVDIHASGGIDNSSWFDPREKDPLMNDYARAGTPAVVAGNLRAAPMGLNGPFLQANFRRMLVINGLNSETNSHEDGTRAHATGTLAMAYATMPELYAYAKGAALPLPWLNSGAYDMSAGLIPATPMPNGANFRQLISPNSQSATNDYNKDQDVAKILATRADRVRAQKAGGTLPPRAELVNAQFNGASDSRALLARVNQFLPATFDNAAHVGLVAAQAGLTTTISLASGGFDAHGQITNTYGAAGNANGSLGRLTTLMQYVWDKAAALGIDSRIFMRVYSEFSRSPLINTGNGKDHYNVGAQVFMEANPTWGNRVFGASGPRHEQLKINPATGQVDMVNGKIMAPRHVHDAVRQYLGFQTTDPRFQMKVPADEKFDFFNPANNTGYPNM